MAQDPIVYAQAQRNPKKGPPPPKGGAGEKKQALEPPIDLEKVALSRDAAARKQHETLRGQVGKVLVPDADIGSKEPFSKLAQADLTVRYYTELVDRDPSNISSHTASLEHAKQTYKKYLDAVQRNYPNGQNRVQAVLDSTEFKNVQSSFATKAADAFLAIEEGKKVKVTAANAGHVVGDISRISLADTELKNSQNYAAKIEGKFAADIAKEEQEQAKVRAAAVTAIIDRATADKARKVEMATAARDRKPDDKKAKKDFESATGQLTNEYRDVAIRIGMLAEQMKDNKGPNGALPEKLTANKRHIEEALAVDFREAGEEAERNPNKFYREWAEKKLLKLSEQNPTIVSSDNQGRLMKLIDPSVADTIRDAGRAADKVIGNVPWRRMPGVLRR